MSTPTPFPDTPTEPTTPSAPEPLAPNPAEPTVPLTPETAPGPASTDTPTAVASDGGSSGAFADDDGEAVGSAEMDADNPVEEDVIDAVDPGGRPD